VEILTQCAPLELKTDSKSSIGKATDLTSQRWLLIARMLASKAWIEEASHTKCLKVFSPSILITDLHDFFSHLSIKQILFILLMFLSMPRISTVSYIEHVVLRFW